MNNGLAWKLALSAAVGIAIWEIAWQTLAPRMTDRTIAEGMAEAEREIYAVIEHLPETKRKEATARDKVHREVMALSGDALADRALVRAESYRRRAASADHLQ